MTEPSHLDIALERIKILHETHPEVRAFCRFPSDVVGQDITPFHVPASDLLQQEKGLQRSNDPQLRDALIAMAPDMIWRETYKDSDIGADFTTRFGCYEIIGRDAPFASQCMRSFLVYHPPHLHYPRHHHPADEIYVVIAGEAEFHMRGQPSRILQAGEAAFHPSGTPHALTSHDHPVLTYVVWRDDFDVAPVWSETEG